MEKERKQNALLALEYGYKKVDEIVKADFYDLNEKQAKTLTGATKDLIAEIVEDNPNIDVKQMKEIFTNEEIDVKHRMNEASKQIIFEDDKKLASKKTLTAFGNYDTIYTSEEDGSVFANKQGHIVMSNEFDSMQKFFFTPAIKYLINTYSKGMKIVGEEVKGADKELLDVLTNLGYYFYAGGKNQITETAHVNSVVGYQIVSEVTHKDLETSAIKIVTISKIDAPDMDLPATIDMIHITMDKAQAIKKYFVQQETAKGDN